MRYVAPLKMALNSARDRPHPSPNRLYDVHSDCSASLGKFAHCTMPVLATGMPNACPISTTALVRSWENNDLGQCKERQLRSFPYENHLFADLEQLSMRGYINIPERRWIASAKAVKRKGFLTASAPAITVFSGFLSSEGVWFGYKGF